MDLTMYLLVYVDDLILTGSDDMLLCRFTHQLAANFPSKILAPCHTSLVYKWFQLHPVFYCRNINIFMIFCRRQKMLSANDIHTPMSPNNVPSLHDGILLLMLLNIGHLLMAYSTCLSPDRIMRLLLTSCLSSCIVLHLNIGLWLNDYLDIFGEQFLMEGFSAENLPSYYMVFLILIGLDTLMIEHQQVPMWYF